jgi:hypothetical protein
MRLAQIEQENAWDCSSGRSISNNKRQGFYYDGVIKSYQDVKSMSSVEKGEYVLSKNNLETRNQGTEQRRRTNRSYYTTREKERE